MLPAVADKRVQLINISGPNRSEGKVGTAAPIASSVGRSEGPIVAERVSSHPSVHGNLSLQWRENK